MKLFKKIFAGTLLVLTAAVLFNAVEPVMAAEKAETTKKVQKKEAGFVASKEGGKYHKASCGLAKNIKPENKIAFKTKAEAEKAGYKPCGVCKP